MNSGDYERKVYIGDGKNDFCPGTKLGERDYVLPRRGMTLSKLLENETYRSKITAKVIDWSTADDVLGIFQQILQN